MQKPSDATRLLVHCIQLDAAGTLHEQIDALIDAPIDWAAFEKAALWHGVAPLAYGGLRHAANRQRVPDRLFETLKTQYRNNLIHNSILFADLTQIIDALETPSIPVILLKGAAITPTIYKDIGLRPMSDIDILVKKEDVGRTIEALFNCGYRQHKGGRLDDMLTDDYHLVTINPDTNVLLEIHWDVSSHRNPSRVRSKAGNLMDIWWSRATNAPSAGQHVFHLHPIDLICLLSAHFFKHRFLKENAGFSTKGGLLQLCDILNTVRFYGDDISWEALRTDAQRFGFRRVVGAAMGIVDAVFADVLGDGPALFEKMEDDPGDQAIARYVAKRICAIKDKDEPVPIEFIPQSDKPSLPGRIAGILRKAFPDPATLSARLDRPIASRWFYLNYLTRAFHLLKKYGPTFFRTQDLREEEALRRWINGSDGHRS